uniref:Uncharacterized protein n=1 Tax=Meloidogyne hapla TaxID=6305 RepID=A0A1I8AXF9_MELHA
MRSFVNDMFRTEFCIRSKCYNEGCEAEMFEFSHMPNKCETCKKLATKMLYIWRLTDVLIVHPWRYEKYVCDDRFINFP